MSCIQDESTITSLASSLFPVPPRKQLNEQRIDALAADHKIAGTQLDAGYQTL